MDELLSYYATRKETLTHAMEKNLVNEQHQRSFDVPAMKYDRIPMNEEEAKTRLFTSLVEDVGMKCNEYLQLTHNPIRDDVSLIFGSDGSKDSVLHQLYEKLNGCKEKASDPLKITTLSEHVVNLDFQELCSRCSGLANRYNSGIMKKLGDYERSVHSRQSRLSFTTRYTGTCIQVVVTMPCPTCPTVEQKSEEVEQSPKIKTLPCIEKDYIENMEELLLQDPIVFIEKALWKWVDDHHCP